MADVLAGLLVGLMTLALAGSYSLLIFNGVLAPYAIWGVTLALVSAVVIGLWSVLNGAFSDQVCIPQDRIAPILGFMSAALVAVMGEVAPPGRIFATLAVSIALSTLFTGLLVYGLGRFRLGNLIRFIPYPVIGGFLAGSGWLLVAGSVRAATGVAFNWSNLPGLFLQGGILPWFPVACFGVGLFALQRFFRHWSVLPGFLLFNVGLFYVWLLATGHTLDYARAHGWLITLVAWEGVQWPGFFEVLQQADWFRVLQMGGAFTAVALTSAVSILLNSSALDVESSRESDLNHELRTLGVGNLLAGLCGGMVGFTSLSLSRLVREAGGRSRLVGVSMVAVCLVCLAGNMHWIGYLPKFVLSGLLLYLGLIFLHEWLVLAWWKLPRTDYAAVVAILGVIASSGYFQGVMVGLLIATLLFVVNYSRVRIVTHVLSGAEQRSNVDRSPQEQALLRENGAKIYILRLQGFIFFGSASSLLGQIRDRLAPGGGEPVEYVVLDFTRVYGLDSSAVLSLRRLRDLVAASEVTLILCGVAPRILEQMRLSGLDTANDPRVSVHPDRDHALEWCEDRLLWKQAGDGGPAAAMDLFARLALTWPVGPVRPDALKPYLDRIEVPAGTRLLRQGEPSDALFFLEQGRLTVKLESANQPDVRLRSMNPGAVVGELGLYLGEPRTASILADVDCVLFRMGRDTLDRLQVEQPALASAFHQCMLRMVASRLVNTSRTLQMVME
ncbi:MAG: SulP family inorganic anion transporter [Candidatus Methylacidiphilales bacterium]|nr:SulP family inorganic anion transporter [Candidatus Methylacidiphilales bacterium]